MHSRNGKMQSTNLAGWISKLVAPVSLQVVGLSILDTVNLPHRSRRPVHSLLLLWLLRRGLPEHVLLDDGKLE